MGGNKWLRKKKDEVWEDKWLRKENDVGGGWGCTGT